MKRQLIKQMRNEWRDNLWMIIALTVVTVAVWILGVLLWTQLNGIFEPRGFDPEGVYTTNHGWVTANSNEYLDYGSGEESEKAYNNDYREILRALRASKNVEAVAVQQNGMPYNYNNNGNIILLSEVKDTVGYHGNFRSGSPDIAKVLRLHSRTGKTPEQLAEMLRDRQLLISPLDGNHAGFRSPEEILGKKVILYGDSSHVYRVGDIIDGVVRSDFEGQVTTIIGVGDMDEETTLYGEITIRVKPDCGAAFEEEFRNTPQMRRHGNLYLYNLTKLTDTRDALQRSDTAEMRFMASLIVLLIAIVMLGLLGTFWFRVQQRTQEIAIRKVCGATSSQLFRRILSEGLLLLVCATIAAGAIVWGIVTLSDIKIIGYFKTSWIIIGEIVAFVLIALGMAISIWWPARRAMMIEPAIAIKDE